jgi:hypothetical protein
MLAPFIIDLLFCCAVLLLAGWASESILVGKPAGRRSVHPEERDDSTRIYRPWKTQPKDDREASWTSWR